LTDQLTVIEQHFQRLESYDAALVYEDSDLDVRPIDAEPPHAEQAVVQDGDTAKPRPSAPGQIDSWDPFAETFAQEETVSDHYTSLESSGGSPAADSRTRDRDVAWQRTRNCAPSEPAEDCSNADAPEAGSGSAEDDLGQDERAQLPHSDSDSVSLSDEPAGPHDDVESPAAIVDSAAIGESTADDSPSGPGVVKARVLRSLPPDDSDLLLIVDEPLESESLDDMPERTHRRRYRDLFTRLRNP
jgi:hypothetical protein